jgi:hypothetical protein
MKNAEHLRMTAELVGPSAKPAARHSGTHHFARGPGIQTLAVLLDSGFEAIGPRFARTHWPRPGMTGP